MHSTLLPDDDLNGADPNAETQIMESINEPEEKPPRKVVRRENPVLPGHIAHRRMMRLRQGPYDPEHPATRRF